MATITANIEVVEPVGGGEAAVQQARQAGVAREHPDVLDAVPAGRLNQDDRLELVELPVAPLAGAEPQPVAHERVHAQREGRLGDEGQPRVRRQIHGAGCRFEPEGQEALAHGRAVPRCRIAAGGYYAPGSLATHFTHWVHRLSRLSRGFST
jgi:hypothetical protein